MLLLASCGSSGAQGDEDVAVAPAPADVVPETNDVEDAQVQAPDSDTVATSPPVNRSPDPGPEPPAPCVVWTPEAADPSAALFDADCVLDVHLELQAADWHALRLQTRPLVDVLQGDCLDGPPDEVFTWFEADVTVSGEQVQRVGVRKKGFLGSLSVDKPSLKIRFDKYVEGQELGTLTRLTLNNMVQDPSLVSACLGYSVMAQAGLPAPRCSFARVYVNGDDLGLY
ncbi:MAG: CotH kinase family protein, partial [Myxococcota bacterium]|nr:CotH kinase family protein [Myxococcota bacterium]